MKDGIFNVIIQYRRDCAVVPIPLNIRFIKHLDKVNMNCHHIDIDHTLKKQPVNVLDESWINRNMVALPMIINSPKTKTECVYYLVDAEWSELSNNNDIIKPMDL